MTRQPRRPRVLIIIENMPFPADRRVWLEATALRDDGYDVSVISPMGQRRWTAHFERCDGIDVHRFPVPDSASGAAGYLREYGLALLGTARLSLRALRRGGFDALQVCNPPDLFFPLGLLYKLLGKRFVFDQHDLTPELFAARYGRERVASRLLLPVLRACEWLTYRVADVVLVTNGSFRARAVRRGGVAANRVFIVRNGPNEERMRRVPPDPALRQGRRHLVCYVGMMGVQDGVDLALEAARWVIRDAGRGDVTFAFLGDGDQLPALQRLAREIGIDDHVVFPGFVDSEVLMRYLCTADIGLAPDPQNGLNEHLTTIKVLEYMAVSLPVVAFDLKETRFSAQSAAAYAVPNDTQQFGRLIVELLDDPARRQSLGDQGRVRIERELAWRYGCEQLLAAYRQVLRPRG